MRKFEHFLKNSSLKKKLLLAFVVTSMIPLSLIIIFSYLNTAHIVRQNAEELIQTNLTQTKSSLDVWVDSYEDILFQIYMNDDIVDMVEKLNEGEDSSEVSAQLRRTLRGLFYTKEHIKCITVITESGEVVFYDLLTGSMTQTSWLGSVGMDKTELYRLLSADNSTHLIPTHKAGVYAAQNYYLFHLGHRIIDYQNVNKPLGVVIVSVDEAMLREVCGGNDGKNGRTNSATFIVGRNGNVLSYPEQAMLGEHMIEWSDDPKEREKRYTDFLKEQKSETVSGGTVNVMYDENFGVDIVNVTDQSELIQSLQVQQKIMLGVLLVTASVLAGFIVVFTKNLTKSISELVRTMETAGKGEMSVRAKLDDYAPTEIKIIETRFNQMMDRLEISLEREKEAVLKQKNAEIMALEAQLNPHFLYNTLDTINWMAIDKGEYELSNAITSLAAILRYGINNSNEIVEVSREVEWLKQYLFLQQTRLKNTFECEIDADTEVMRWKIHKLLFQPFVENAILHGFEGKKGVHILKITIAPDKDKLKLRIWDNGKGISKELLKKLNAGIYQKTQEKHSIGMENAITRLEMYYGGKGMVKIDSEEGVYTSVEMYIPKCVSEEKQGSELCAEV